MSEDIAHSYQDEETGLWVHITTDLKFQIPPRIREEALGMCGCIYRWNSPNAVGYAFNFIKGESKNGICNGEFVHRIRDIIDRYDFVYLFSEKDFYSPLWSSYKNIIGELNKKDAEKWGVSNK